MVFTSVVLTQIGVWTEFDLVDDSQQEPPTIYFIQQLVI